MAEMLETTPEEMRGRPLSDFMTPEDFEVAAQKIAEQLTHGARHQIDVRFRRVDGSFIYCLLAGNAILDQDGKFVGSLAMCMDITDRKRAQEERAKMEEQFLQAQKMEAIGTLAGGIAHDFNNILAAIQGYGEMVLNNLAPGSQDYQDQQEVLQAAERAIQLVRQILTFSRKTKSKRVLVSLPVMVQEVCKLMHASLPATIEVRQALEEREANVIADPIEIHQILVNLCTNAGYSMQDSGGRLMIKLRRHKVDGTGSYGVELEPGDYYVLSVSDTGCGIPEEILSRIFEPFFTTKGAGEGTGLGLSTVHGVAKALGGRVSVYSEVGKGTTFNVYLPSADGGHTEVVKQEVTTGTERILFVDDEAPLVRLGKHILEDLGYSVVALADSTQALEIFEAAPGDFDLVVTDETMPKLKGSDLARRIAEIRPDLPVILCTGYGQELSGLPDSVGTVLHKPVSRTELSHAIREVLEKNPRP